MVLIMATSNIEWNSVEYCFSGTILDNINHIEEVFLNSTPYLTQYVHNIFPEFFQQTNFESKKYFVLLNIYLNQKVAFQRFLAFKTLQLNRNLY